MREHESARARARARARLRGSGEGWFAGSGTHLGLLPRDSRSSAMQMRAAGRAIGSRWHQNREPESHGRLEGFGRRFAGEFCD